MKLAIRPRWAPSHSRFEQMGAISYAFGFKHFASASWSIGSLRGRVVIWNLLTSLCSCWGLGHCFSKHSIEAFNEYRNEMLAEFMGETVL